jgi:hypothetical protein
MDQNTTRVNDSERYLNFGRYCICNGTGKFVPVYAMKTYGVVEVQRHSFLTSALAMNFP